MSQPVDELAIVHLREQIKITADRIRIAWAWLGLLVEPGHATVPSGTAVDDERAERLEAIGHSDRTYRFLNLREGMSALPPSPAPVRVGTVDTQVAVHAYVGVAVRMLANTGSSAHTWARADAAMATVPTALDWLVGHDVGLGVDGLDGVWLRQGAVDRVRDAELAAAVDRLLQRADRAARVITGDQDDAPIRPLEHRCPACGRRSLQLEITGRDRSAWLTRCVSERCRCTGPGDQATAACGCLRRAPADVGRHHVWRYSDLDGPLGLIAALDRYDRQRPDVVAGAVGHGGWQSRNMIRPVADSDGRQWWTKTHAVAQLGVDRARLGDWVRRSKAAGHVAGAPPAGCPACGHLGFPHVDPPRRFGAAGAYLAEQLLEVETYTAESRRGGASRRVT